MQGVDRLHDLRARAAQCHGEAQTQALLKEAATLISELLLTTPAADQTTLPSQNPLPSAGATLLDLMTRIEIPHPLQPRLEKVKTEIIQAETVEQVRVAVQAIADLMSDIRRQVQNEKHDLETFLEGVTNRIQVLSENVVDLRDNRQASTHSRQALQQSFHTHMQGIRTRMADSDDVEALKHAIKDGLDAIELQLTNHVQREEQLTRDAEQRIADLTERLYDMKNETSLLQREIQEQRDLAMKDPLTGASSRLAMEEHIDREFNRWKRYADPLALCIVDIDHFKRINDTFGHLAGDKVLKALAERVRKNVREVDIVSRYGGEEFVVIMPNTLLDAAYQVAEKLRGMVAASGFRYGKEPVHVTVSCGVATFHQGDDPQSVFERADAALYEAKHGGRNRTHLEEDPAADAIKRSIA
jgi:diguanylate cyclase